MAKLDAFATATSTPPTTAAELLALLRTDDALRRDLRLHALYVHLRASDDTGDHDAATADAALDAAADRLAADAATRAPSSGSAAAGVRAASPHAERRGLVPLPRRSRPARCRSAAPASERRGRRVLRGPALDSLEAYAVAPSCAAPAGLRPAPIAPGRSRRTSRVPRRMVAVAADEPAFAGAAGAERDDPGRCGAAQGFSGPPPTRAYAATGPRLVPRRAAPSRRSRRSPAWARTHARGRPPRRAQAPERRASRRSRGTWRPPTAGSRNCIPSPIALAR